MSPWSGREAGSTQAFRSLDEDGLGLFELVEGAGEMDAEEEWVKDKPEAEIDWLEKGDIGKRQAGGFNGGWWSGYHLLNTCVLYIHRAGRGRSRAESDVVVCVSKI